MSAVQAVGIDLGTTFSAIAIIKDTGQAEVIANAEGELTTPSVALWHNNAFLVGQPAIDLVHNARGSERDRLSAALIRGVKRMMGHLASGSLVSNGHRTSPVEVSAAILASLARSASARLGFSVGEAVITVPAHFGDRERNMTKKAAEMAGLRVLRMINEPSAAALTYSKDQQAQPGKALVFDLGGGTFDATVLQLDKREPRVLATEGIEELGGVNFTNSLATYLQQRYEALTRIPYPQESTALDHLIHVAEQAKRELSYVETTTVRLSPAQGTAVEVSVTRQQFEELIDIFLFQLQTAVEMALQQAHLSPSDVQRVLLCGGSSRIPAIQTMLQELFERPPEKVLNLDLSVALGAAYEAAHMVQVRSSISSAPSMRGGPIGLQAVSGLVIDCVSYAVGIAAISPRGDGYTKLVLLHPGEPLNTWSTPFTMRIVGDTKDFPPLRVYQGEGTILAEKDFLGEILITLPPDTPAGAYATIKMLQDQNGMLQIQLNVAGKELPGYLRRE